MSEKPLKIEINLIVNQNSKGYNCMVGIGVYNSHSDDAGEKPIFEKVIQDNKDPTEVMAYILHKYVAKKCFKWHNVTYDKDRCVMRLYGFDMRQ